MSSFGESDFTVEGRRGYMLFADGAGSLTSSRLMTGDLRTGTITVTDVVSGNISTPSIQVTSDATISNLTVNNIYSTNDLRISTANKNIYLFNSNVGIGTTSLLDDKLYIYGNARVSNTLIAQYVGVGTSPTTNLHVVGTVSATKDVFIDGLFSGAKMRLGSLISLGGPVDSNLSSNLNVAGYVSASNVITSNLDVHYITSSYNEIIMETNVNLEQNLVVDGKITTTELEISNLIISNIYSPSSLTLTAPQDLILSTSNVGIGTTEPLYEVHINKDVLVNNVKIENSLTAAGDVTIGGTYQGTKIRVGSQLISNLVSSTGSTVVQGSLTVDDGISSGPITATEIITSNISSVLSDYDSNSQIEVVNTLGEAGMSLKSASQSPTYISQSNIGDCRMENNGTGNVYISQRNGGNIYMQVLNRSNLLVLDSSGRVGISSSTPAYTFDVSSGTSRISSFYANPFNSTNEPQFYFSNNLFGKDQVTFINADARINIKDYGGRFIRFFDETQLAGSITQTGGTTNYNSNSDYRIKNNIEPLDDPLNTICSLNPVQFTFRNHNTIIPGFLAHEVQSFIPSAVVGLKDAITENGDILPQQMDKTHIIPYLVAAVKELKTRLEALENKQ